MPSDWVYFRGHRDRVINMIYITVFHVLNNFNTSNKTTTAPQQCGSTHSSWVERNLEHVRIVAHEMRLQTGRYVGGQLGEILTILLGQNDASDAAAFGLRNTITDQTSRIVNGAVVVWNLGFLPRWFSL